MHDILVVPTPDRLFCVAHQKMGEFCSPTDLHYDLWSIIGVCIAKFVPKKNSDTFVIASQCLRKYFLSIEANKRSKTCDMCFLCTEK